MGNFKYKLKEVSSTGTGASFHSGTEGENYSIPIKSKKYKLKEIDTNTDQLVKDLNITNPAMVDWVTKRIEAFNILERQLNQLIPLLQQAKKETIKQYSQNPNFGVIYGTDLAQEYLNDTIELFKQPT
jgi:hypothetical protein